MIITEEKIKKMNEVINRVFNGLIIEVTGKSSLTKEELKFIANDPTNQNLIQAAYMIGKTHAELPGQTKMAATLKEFLIQMEQKRGGRSLSALQRYAINAIRMATSNDLKVVRDRTRNLLENLIRTVNLEYRNKTIGTVIAQELEEGIVANVPFKLIAKRLREATKDLKTNWRRVATTSIADASNIGRMDAIIERNPNKPVSEILVYKQTSKDAYVCDSCKKFYENKDGTPKLYKLSELQANGSNYGKKRADWSPVIGADHPFSRCVLLEMPEGLDFKPGSSNLKFVKEKH